MPVEKMKKASTLFDPKAPMAPLLEKISGRAKTEEPLTQRAYTQIQQALLKQKSRQRARSEFWSTPAGSTKPKLSFLIDKAEIPRVLAQKMTDLTEGYHRQLDELLETTWELEGDNVELAAPELQGNFEKSRETARRFQEAMEGIEELYADLRDRSSQAASAALNRVQSQQIEFGVKRQLINWLIKSYELDVVEGTGNVPSKVTPRKTLLPLIKGADVHARKQSAFEYLLSFGTKKNSSSNRDNQTTTKSGTVIQMLHQVQPKHGTSVFSDHAGFVVKFSRVKKDCPPLYVYYHSLEHGYQHTNTRTALNFGSQHSLHVMNQWQGNSQPSQGGSSSIHEPRAAYIAHLNDGLLATLVKHAATDGANLVIIVGECTLSIHEAMLNLVMQNSFDESTETWSRVTATRVHGVPTVIQNYDLEVVHANKLSTKTTSSKSKKVDDDDGGLGVHALMAYVFLNTNIPAIARAFTLDPYLLTLTDGTHQNFLSLSYGPKHELHAFAHLLNKKEDKLAKELQGCSYVSVSGDLNNLSIGSDLVETVNETNSFMSMGSNSTSSKMYDKVTLLE